MKSNYRFDNGEKMYNGIINVYKEKGFTSHDVVAKMRGICGQKKIGHTGTLDPDAEGVLPVCLGNATKVCDLLTDRSKTYLATMHLGIVTDTQDMTGTVLSTSEKFPKVAQIEEVIASYVGEYDQIPPMYSALKVNGKKLYELAREGKVIERKARRVEILEIVIEEIKLPFVKMRVSCSKGTYIRTLCHDIGQDLGCGACMEYLLRSRVGEFELSDAIKLSKLQIKKDAGTLEESVIAVDQIFAQYRKFMTIEEAQKHLENGNRMQETDFTKSPGLDEAPFRVYDFNDKFFGIYAFDQEKGDYKPVKMFMTL